MQSGISVSRELHDAFNGLVASTSQRGLLAGIKNEQLVPLESIDSTSADFLDDLAPLSNLLKENEAAYIILRRYPDASDAYVAVTYVPDTANVRQKMLFASTRLTLVRELGSEKFRDTVFATRKDELSAEGFKRQDKHDKQKAPLTEEEQTLESVRQAEAEASTGTTARSSHVKNSLAFPVSDQAREALRELARGTDNLVQLAIDVPNETIELAGTTSISPDLLAGAISGDEPRFSFYRHDHDFEGERQSPIAFIYTCPSGSKIKERMLYASSRANVVEVAGTEAGLLIEKRLEASSPDEITAATLDEDFHPKKQEKVAFARPKRPGRR